MAEKRELTFVDLFAGCGGLSLEMEQAGFTPVFSNEIRDVAAEKYRRNRGMDKSHVFVGDINYLVSQPRCVRDASSWRTSVAWPPARSVLLSLST